MKSNRILFFGLLTLLIISMIIGALKTEKPAFILSTDEMLNEVKNYDKNTIGPEKLIDILQNNDSLYRFIDLRNPKEFAKGHIENAINIPLQNILNEEYSDIFNQDKKINVLYFSDHRGACTPWMLLTQVGYKNNKILLGGYDFVKTSIIDNFSPMTGNFKDEKAKYDYNEVISKLKGGSISTTSTSVENTETVPVVKKEKKTQGGGC